MRTGAVVAAKTEGMAALRKRILETLPKATKDKMREANEKNATEFRDLVARTVPHGHPESPNLGQTLTMGPATRSEIGVAVSIGGPEAPYPLHLEAGHRTKQGKHVPGKPFWNPAKQVLKKRAKGRAARALTAAVKITAAGKL